MSFPFFHNGRLLFCNGGLAAECCPEQSDSSSSSSSSGGECDCGPNYLDGSLRLVFDNSEDGIDNDCSGADCATLYCANEPGGGCGVATSTVIYLSSDGARGDVWLEADGVAFWGRGFYPGDTIEETVTIPPHTTLKWGGEDTSGTFAGYLWGNMGRLT